jgi:DNA-binding NarL/FixJ family response regulator
VDGLEVLEALGDITTPVLMLTSSQAPEHIRAAYSAGANGYLVKPHDVNAWRSLAQAIDIHWFIVGRLPA